MAKPTNLDLLDTEISELEIRRGEIQDEIIRLRNLAKATPEKIGDYQKRVVELKTADEALEIEIEGLKESRPGVLAKTGSKRIAPLIEKRKIAAAELPGFISEALAALETAASCLQDFSSTKGLVEKFTAEIAFIAAATGAKSADTIQAGQVPVEEFYSSLQKIRTSMDFTASDPFKLETRTFQERTKQIRAEREEQRREQLDPTIKARRLKQEADEQRHRENYAKSLGESIGNIPQFRF